jgi:hypothetical protein
MVREPGFYWVKFVPWKWVVVEYRQDVNSLWNRNPHWIDGWTDDEFYEIGSRIEEPK